MGKKQLLYLSQAGVASVGLTMAEIIEALETAFREKGEGRVEMPPKPGIHPGGGDNFIHLASRRHARDGQVLHG